MIFFLRTCYGISRRRRNYHRTEMTGKEMEFATKCLLVWGGGIVILFIRIVREMGNKFYRQYFNIFNSNDVSKWNTMNLIVKCDENNEEFSHVFSSTICPIFFFLFLTLSAWRNFEIIINKTATECKIPIIVTSKKKKSHFDELVNRK